MKKHVALEFICAFLAFLFVYAGSAKLINFSGNLHDMNNQPFPSWFARLLAYGLPPSELVIASMIAINRTRGWGLCLYLVLMSLFTLYIVAILLHFFPKVPCSCGGVIKYLTWTQHLWFNLFFLGLTLIAICLRKRITKTIDHHIHA